MMPTGPSAPGGGAQSVGPPLFRANSGSLGGAAQSQPQPQFSLVSPRNQFSNSLLGNMSSVSGFLNNHSFGNGVPGSGLSGLQQRGGVVGAEQDPMTFTSSSSPGQQQFLNNYGSDRQPSPQLDAMQNFQAPHSQQQQQQLHGGMFNGGSMGPVKSEEPGEQSSSQRGGIGPVKLEQQQLQSLRSLVPVKMDSQHSEQSMFLQHHQQQKQQQQQQHQQQQQQQQQQHQQQQQILQLSRQNSPTTAAQLNMLQHQRIMQLQQQQQQQKQQLQQHQHQQLQQHQQQSLNALPQQRTQLQQQLRQNMQTQVKPSSYEPGTCARRLTQYMYHQQQRPEDNNIEFWRKFVTDFFAPTAKKRWCVSLYGSGRQTTGVFPQDAWHCEICNRKPVRGFETTFEVLPRLCQIKYASGTLEELLYVDMPHEYHNASGQIVLDYAKAIQESVFEQLRVVRDGQLRIVFNSDLKICSWEFCARHHEELIPRRLLIPQVSQLGAVIQKSQAAGQNGPSEMSTQDLLNSCNSFVSTARQLVKALEVPLVNDLGYTKRYVRCLQISEVVNSMKDLIDYSRETRIGPIDSLNNFPRRTSTSLGTPSQQEAQQSIPHNANHSDQGPVHATMQLPMAHSGPSMNNHHNAASSTSTITAATLLHQNSMNSRQENQIQMGAVNSPYRGGITAPIPSTSSSSSLPPMHPNPSGSNNAISNSHHQLNSVSSPVNISSLGADPSDSQSSVQQILQEMSSQLSGVGGIGNKMKISNGIGPMINGGNGLTNNGMATSSSSPAIGGMPFRSTGGFSTSATVNGIRGTVTNNAMSMDGSGINSVARDPTGMSHQQLQDMGNRLLGRFGTANNFNNFQFD